MGSEMCIRDSSLVGKFWNDFQLKFKPKEGIPIVPWNFKGLRSRHASSGILQKRFKGILKQMKWDDTKYTFHSCKRGGTTTAIKQGLSLEQVVKLGRWSSKEMVNLYNRPNSNDLTKMSEKMLN